MKKLLALASAGVMLFSAGGVAFARHDGHHSQSGTVNTAIVLQSVVSVADSGGNEQTAGRRGTNRMTTGSNIESEATGVVVANTQIGCSSCSRHESTVTNTAIVGQDVSSGAYSGGNTQTSGRRGNNTLTTGSDVSSEATGVVVVNTSWTGSL